MQQVDLTGSYCTPIPVFFIVGRGRSGSTMLTSLLNNHKNVIAPEESRFVQELYYAFGKVKKWTPAKKDAFLQEVFRGFEPLDIDKNVLKERLHKQPENVHLSDMLRQVYLSIVHKETKSAIKIIVDKNPKYTFFLRELVKIFPEAKFVHLTRDYRDTYLSFKRVQGMKGERKSVAFQVARWVYYHKEILRFKKNLPSHAYFHLRYEDLVRQPEDSLKKLCTFLNIDFQDNILLLKSQERTGTRQKIHQSLNEPLTDKKVFEWKKTLPAKQKLIADSIARKYAPLFGYELHNTSPSIMKSFLSYPMRIFAIFPLYMKKKLFKYKWLMRMFYALKKRSD